VRHRAAASLTPLSGPLGLAAALAAVAGCLDAVSLARLTGTFVAFQSGNTVITGLELGRGHFAAAWPPLVAVVTYLAGSACTPYVIRGGRTGVAGARARLLGWTVALLSLDALVVLVGFGAGNERPSGALRYLGIVVATLAMAMQTPVVRAVDGVTVSTTFSSGMLVRLGQSLGDLVHRDARVRERPVTRILGVVNLSFLGGAVVGGVLLERLGNLAVVVPVLAVLVVALVTIRSGRGRVEGP
jgi:uncharacterized membrane protein YoaK (UPF0700 family)